LTENYEVEENAGLGVNDLISYDYLIELARKAGDAVIDARDALIELAIK